MKILHTSDWHLGKNLEGYRRIDEQIEFIDELVQIAEDENIDLILLSGDIYDTINPPAYAEKLFYKSMIRLSNNARRPIVVIAGNHDSPTRLQAVSPLAIENGIIIMATLKTIIKPESYDYFRINKSGEGFIEIEINGETAVIITVGYPSEMRLNEYLHVTLEDADIMKNYSDRIGEILLDLSRNFSQDKINLIMGHFYITGGLQEDSERDISLGGSFAVDGRVIPPLTQYVAMGHLHRAQRVAKSPIEHAYYSGSPIQYDKSEIKYKKYVFSFDITPNSKGIFKKIELKNYKPIEIWKTNSIEDALELCAKNSEKDCYVYLEIKTDRTLKQSEIKELRKSKKDIVEILPIFDIIEENSDYESYVEKSIKEEFVDFYKSKRNVEPQEELINLFLSINKELDEESEGELD